MLEPGGQTPAAATDSVVVLSTPPPRHTSSSPSMSVDCTPTVSQALFFRQLGNQLFSLLQDSIIDKLEYRASGVNLQYFIKPVNERYPADHFIDVCDELLTFLFIDQERDLSNFLMVQKKYMYRLGHEIYGNCVTKIAENGYCLYHVATLLSNLDKRSNVVEDIVKDLSMDSFDDIKSLLAVFGEVAKSPGLRFTQELTTFTNLYGIFYTPFTPFYAFLRPFTNHLLQNNNTNQRSY